MEHHFNVEIATKFGMVEAILLNRLWFWIEKNRTEERNFYDGRYWTFNSRKALQELFPYLTERKIRNALNRLVDAGILVTGSYNKVPFDRTIWYAFTDMGEQLMKGKLQFGEIDLTKSQMTFDKKSNENVSKGQTNTSCYTVITPVGDSIYTDFQKVKSESVSKLREEFETLWAIYPKKQGKDKAFSYYQKARKSGTTYEEVGNGIAAYRRYVENNRIDMQYVKMGSTFFSQKSWQDDWDIVNGSREESREEFFARLIRENGDDV